MALRRFTRASVLAVRYQSNDLDPWAVLGVQPKAFSERTLSRPESMGKLLIDDCHGRRAVHIVLGEVPTGQKRGSHRPKEIVSYTVIVNGRPLVIWNWRFPLNVHVTIAEIAPTERRKDSCTGV
jgi:hypothetical protein